MFRIRNLRTLSTGVRAFVSVSDLNSEISRQWFKDTETLFRNGSPVLTSLREPCWGPLPTLELEHFSSKTAILRTSWRTVCEGLTLPESLGVLRFPFTTTYKSLHDVRHEQSTRNVLRLKVIWCPSHRDRKRCFLPAKAYHQTQNRCLVDQYYRSSTYQYRLRTPSMDLVSFLKQHGFVVSFLPDRLFKAKATGCDCIEQSTNSVLMVSPTRFKYNTGAAEDNAFMVRSDQSEARNLRNTVLKEFQGLYQSMIEEAKIKVNLFEHDPELDTPDAVFPNNWFTTHKTKESIDPYDLVLYPLRVPNRRLERRSQIIEFLKMSNDRDRILDLTEFEEEGRFLEGTGSLVLDRINRVAFLSISERSDLKLAENWTKQMNYSNLIHFEAKDDTNVPIYHTNVLMSIGSYFAVICLEALHDSKEMRRVGDVLSRERTLVTITRDQMQSMCGNVLELLDEDDLPVLCMSSQAFHAFTPDQIQTLKQNVRKIIHAPIDVLERTGGGSVRCTIAELF